MNKRRLEELAQEYKTNHKITDNQTAIDTIYETYTNIFELAEDLNTAETQELYHDYEKTLTDTLDELALLMALLSNILLKGENKYE